MERIGPYILEAALARGGMGEVWRARLEGPGGFSRAVALKRMNADLSAASGGDGAFLREARAGARLLHPNIAAVLDVGEDGRTLYLAMELVDGLDLRRILRRGEMLGLPMPPALVGFIAHEVLAALEAAHALRGPGGEAEPLVHRDISPENVIVGRWGEVRVVDFGLARTTGLQDQLTDAGVVKGKLSYMAPEQLQGAPVHPSWDVYALGNLFYEALCGEKPYDAPNPIVAVELARSPVRHPCDLRAGVPRALADAALALRAPDPAHRPSAAEARRQLAGVLEDLLRGVPSALLADYLAFVTTQEAPPGGARQGAPCGKCGGRLRGQWIANGIVVDRCEDCHGAWLDAHEVERVVGRRLTRGDSERTLPGAAAPLDAVRGDCPRGHGPLGAWPVPGRGFHVEACATCGGVWLDAGELDAVSHGDVAAALLAAAVESA
ncbi:MAG: protein kinase [Deltaproteobacteria bacterium]|nr:protein kinase [Deltaproteobacteria bacterium]